MTCVFRRRFASLLRVASLVLCVLGSGATLFAQGYSPEEACRHMTLPAEFEAKLVASEPMVRQPVAIEFDDRGRLWVIQYLQYPNPAGLKRVRVDRYSRTVYDRVPEPPPHGTKGADRITILDDFDANGRAHHSKDFVGGLNLATGLAIGNGGVYVLQVPYLLFYADRNGDDIPDGDPEVLLTGFGMEDAHSVANSLTWGPDGWLYGCQGSTVTAHIRGIEFQQGVWRYHPRTRRFELFCEGGGNSWGLDFDRHGNLFYSTNVGGFVMLHGVQGAYYWKQFGKHGALHNPYAYGHIEHVLHHNFQGGHVAVGGLIYQGDAFPERFRGKYITGDLLGHAVYWHDLTPDGSSFQSAHGGTLLAANDTWFATSDVTTGPDGSVYVADWCDKRMAHPDPDADWDRSNGRIYKIEARQRKPPAEIELAGLSSEKLVDLLSHPNDWYVRRARRMLGERRDASVFTPLRNRILENSNDQLALESLWALYVNGDCDDGLLQELLSHRNPDVRRWAVRFLGDEGKVSPQIARQLAAMAASEPDVTVRSQLACSARRLPAEAGLSIVEQLVRHDGDIRDPHIPLLLWWAVEQNAVPAMDRVLSLFAGPDAWQHPLIRDQIIERLVRRYAAEGSPAAEAACVRLLKSAPTSADRARLVAALDLGLKERSSSSGQENLGTLFTQYASVHADTAINRKAVQVMPALRSLLAELWHTDRSNVSYLRVLSHLGESAAQDQAWHLALDPHVDTATRSMLLAIVGETGEARFLPGLLRLIDAGQPEPIQVAALEALTRYDRPEIATKLVHDYPGLRDRLKSRVLSVLLSRRIWALALLAEIDAGKIAAKEIPVDELRGLAQFHDRQLNDLVRKHWGDIRGGTPEEKLAEMRRLNNDLRAQAGNPAAGHLLFAKHCATCHRLFNEGNRIGPELTFANRHDRDFLLASLVDPSSVIRKEYLSYVVRTEDGQVLTGLVIAQTQGEIILLTAKNERATVARSKIESMTESPVSLMPENLLKQLQPAEVRDLFAYLQGDKPVALRK
jgi:putative membrane-bound dehydrogenase-like protein